MIDEAPRTDRASPRDAIAVFMLAIAAVPVQYLLQAIAIFATSGCWPIAWRWNQPHARMGRGAPWVNDPACSAAAWWSIFDNAVLHPLFAVLLALIAFYAIRPLRERMRRHIAEAEQRVTSRERDE